MSMFDDFKKGRKHDPKPREAGDLTKDDKKKRVRKRRGNAVSVGVVQFILSIVGIVVSGAAIYGIGWIVYQAIRAYTGM